jgi:HPt (histidine-containing phosphotransfer) domain-containing protein
MHRLKQAALANDAPEMARAAHSLKSSSANVGAMVLSRYCADVEALARRAETEEARKILLSIETEHGGVQTALTAEFEALATKA